MRGEPTQAGSRSASAAKFSVSSFERERRWQDGMVIFHKLGQVESRKILAAGGVRDRRRQCWLIPDAACAELIGFVRVKGAGRGIYARKPKVHPCPDCERHRASGRWGLFDGDGDHDACLRCGTLIQIDWSIPA